MPHPSDHVVPVQYEVDTGTFRYLDDETGLTRPVVGSPAASSLAIRPKRPQSTVVTGFQSGHGFFSSGVGSFLDPDTSSFVNGTQSVKITTDGAGGIGYWKKNNISPTIDMSGKFLRVWCRLPDPNDQNNIAGIAVHVSSDNNVANYGFKEFGALGTPTQRHFISADFDWTGITLSWGELSITGSPNRAAINSVWLKAWDRNGLPIQVQFGGVELLPEPSNGVVSFSFDDGFATQYTNARAKLSQYRYPATAYIIRDRVATTNYMTLAQLKALQDQHSWEIAAHADTVANHDLTFTGLSSTVLEQELRGIRSWLADNGFGGAAHLAYPLGEHNPTVYALARKYFRSARSTYSLSRETYPPADYNKLRVFNTDNTTTFAAVQAAITRAAANKEWLILLFHDITTGAATKNTQMTATIFGQIVDEVASQGLAVRPVGSVVEHGI